MTMNKYECGVIRVKSAGQLQTKQISTAGGRASLQSFHPRFICVIRGHHFPMRDRESTHPFVFFFLVLPYGISSGFVSITLPFILTRVGFSVALAASIVAIGVSANLWRFLWGPVADLTLTARRWYLLGLGTSAATLVILALLPLHQNAVPVLMTVIFISQVAGTLIVLPVGGLMAHTVAENAKGRAAGWYQAGNLGGNGIGGGVGVWLASHFSKENAGGGLAITMFASAAAIYFASDVRVVAPSVASSAVGSRIALGGCGHISDQEFLLRWSRLSWRWRRARPTRSPSAFLPTP